MDFRNGDNDVFDPEYYQWFVTIFKILQIIWRYIVTDIFVINSFLIMDSLWQSNNKVLPLQNYRVGIVSSLNKWLHSRIFKNLLLHTSEHMEPKLLGKMLLRLQPLFYDVPRFIGSINVAKILFPLPPEKVCFWSKDFFKVTDSVVKLKR